VNREPNSAIQPRHYDLVVWKDAMRLVGQVYRLTQSFPDVERYGLTQQIRRAAVSVPSNIAEGAARGTRPELVRFLSIARGSLSELDTQLWIARDLGYLSADDLSHDVVQHLFARLNSLIRSNQRGERGDAP
jgi:four helix bundle protein